MNQIRTSLWYGLSFTIAGWLLAILVWPHTVTDPAVTDSSGSVLLPATYSQKGSWFGVYSGMSIAGIGEVLLTLVLIAVAVKWGIEAAAEAREKPPVIETAAQA